MLLIEHDQAQALHRQEHRRAGAYHHTGLVAAAAAPGRQPFRDPQAGVIGHHRCPKAAPTAVEQLGDQADLWGEHQHTAAGGQFLGAAAQIHLGFARTGHPPEQPLPLFWLGLPLVEQLCLGAT